MRSADVVLTGEYYCDLIFADLPGAPRLGAELVARDLAVLPGGTYNIALALTRLGLDIHWAADFGTDLFSALVLEQAARDGLSPMLFNRLDTPLRRVTSVFSSGGDRGFLTYGDGAIVPPPAGTLDQVRPTWLLQTFRFEPAWLAFMREAKAGGAKLFADCRGGDFSLETPGVREFLSLLDVFSPNEDEAMALTGMQHPKKAAAMLAELVPIVAIKRGADGALVSGPGPLDQGRGAPGAGQGHDRGRRHLQWRVPLWALLGALHRGGGGTGRARRFAVGHRLRRPGGADAQRAQKIRRGAGQGKDVSRNSLVSPALS